MSRERERREEERRGETFRNETFRAVKKWERKQLAKGKERGNKREGRGEKRRKRRKRNHLVHLVLPQENVKKLALF